MRRLRQRLQERRRAGAAQEAGPQDRRAAGHQGPQREEGPQEKVSALFINIDMWLRDIHQRNTT